MIVQKFKLSSDHKNLNFIQPLAQEFHKYYVTTLFGELLSVLLLVITVEG